MTPDLLWLLVVLLTQTLAVAVVFGTASWFQIKLGADLKSSVTQFEKAI
jgi:type IV secretory pathway TrbD component